MNLPNKITVFRFCCIPLLMFFSLVEFKYHWVGALLVYFIACMSDKADGIIARKHGLVTDFGKVMDPLSDKTLVFAAYLVFINMDGIQNFAFYLCLQGNSLLQESECLQQQTVKLLQQMLLANAKHFCRCQLPV